MYKRIIALIFLGFILSCKSNNDAKFIERYKNGQIKSKTYKKEKTGGFVIFNYDSIGRVESVRNYKDGVFYGLYKDFFDYQVYRGEEGGTILNGKKIKEYEKYYFSHSNILHSEVYFVRVDSMNWDNFHKTYSEKGEVIEESSCFLEMTTMKDTIELGEDYRIHFKAPCLDYKKIELYIGDFDKVYRLAGNHFDTLTCEGNSIEYTLQPTIPGMQVLRGYVKRFSIDTLDGGIGISSKNLYFSKYFFVKKR